VTSKIH